MAKQLIRTYTFSPGGAGAGSVVIPGKWDLNQILLITNSRSNSFIYNFADPSFSGTTVTFTRGNNAAFPTATWNYDGFTTITLAYSTVNMFATDPLQIFVERNEVITRPWPMGTDAFERTRTANPTSMLDADFEYGLQPTKWQQIETLRNYPSIFEVPGTDQTVTAITTNASGAVADTSIQSLITVTLANNHGFSVGQPISINALLPTVYGYARAQGNFIINSIPAPNMLTYYAKGKVGNLINDSLYATYTILRKGGFYTGAAIGTSTFTTSGSGASTKGIVTVSFANNHGLVPGSTILVVINSDGGGNNHAFCQGSFYVESVPSLTQLTYTARQVGTITGNPIGGVYARPDSFYLHRPFDGGVALGTNGPSHGMQAIRMSKKYMRYQSGKAINYNTAALFAPNYDIRTLTATNVVIGSTLYVTTDDLDHGLQVGSGIQISGATTEGYNGYYSVNSIVDERTFTCITTQTLASVTGNFSAPALVQHTSWHGSTIRAGTFDEQNGIFWQYDGIQLAAVQRAGTFQCAGTVAVTPDSNLIVGTATRFDTQLVAGDRVVIKGMTHLVTSITSSTWMYVNPDYRGVSASSGIKMTKVTERSYPQNQWNVDRCDGSGGIYNPSGFYINPAKIQMIGLQWTWYGAGFIDWMIRGPEGNYIVCHRQKNGNVNTEAYMRSGNQPVRYEITNEGARSSLVQQISAVGTVMTVTDVTYFPNTGTVYIDNELINYSGKVGTTGQGQLTGLTRATGLNYFAGGAQRNFTAGAAAIHAGNVGVLLVSQQATPSISHWGSAFIQDGGFDSDRGYIFNYQALNVQAQLRKTTAFAIRLAPSVSNAITGDLGARDLINRAQLLLEEIAITAGGSTATNQAIVVEGVLNPSNYPIDPTKIQWYTVQGTPAGGSQQGSGQPSFAQIAPGNQIMFDGTATYSTTLAAQGNVGDRTLTVATTASMQVGDIVTGAGMSGNSQILAVGAGKVTVSNPVLSTMPSGTTTITMYRNQWAVAGETVFSMISSPSSKDSLDLTTLKELTNTPLGGRGTFPNGPDTLFINVYLSSGNPIYANMILRWGEAQA